MGGTLKEGDDVDSIYRTGGKVVSLHSGNVAVVQWRTGMRSVHSLHELQRSKPREEPLTPRRTKKRLTSALLYRLREAGADPELEDESDEKARALCLAWDLAAELAARVDEERCEHCPTHPGFVACPRCGVVT